MAAAAVPPAMHHFARTRSLHFVNEILFYMCIIHIREFVFCFFGWCKMKSAIDTSISTPQTKEFHVATCSESPIICHQHSVWRETRLQNALMLSIWIFPVQVPSRAKQGPLHYEKLPLYWSCSYQNFFANVYVHTFFHGVFASTVFHRIVPTTMGCVFPWPSCSL